MPHSTPELAKRSLLPDGLDYGHFADQIMLPNTIVTYANEAIHYAAQSDREQRVGFSYVREKWVAGPPYPGTKYELHGDNVEIYDGGLPAFLHLINRPEIMLHARPRPKRAIIDVLAEDLFGDKLPEERLEQKKQRAWEDALALGPIATCSDIENTYERSWGTVGNMISTGEGSFLWLRRDVSNTEATPHETLLDRGKDALGFESSRLHLRKSYEQLAPLILKEAGRKKKGRREAYAQIAARMLFGHYACYMNDNPASPVMNKVHLG